MNLKSSEFRIGNLLQDAKGNLQKVSDLNDGIQGISVSRLERKRKTVLPISEIPLTDDLLMDLGGVIKHDAVLFEGVHFLKDGDSIYFESENNGRTDTEIKYIHQLQNIYFALTGEELTFNQTKKA